MVWNIAKNSTHSRIFLNYLWKYIIAILKDCPVDFNPLYYRRYVDDSFIIFKSRDHILPYQFHIYMKLKKTIVFHFLTLIFYFQIKNFWHLITVNLLLLAFSLISKILFW